MLLNTDPIRTRIHNIVAPMLKSKTVPSLFFVFLLSFFLSYKLATRLPVSMSFSIKRMSFPIEDNILFFYTGNKGQKKVIIYFLTYMKQQIFAWLISCIARHRIRIRNYNSDPDRYHPLFLTES